MSLINDALKRAKQAQRPNSPDAPQMRVQFRLIDPSLQAKKSNSGIWIALLLVAGLIVGFFTLQSTRKNSLAGKEAKAREIVPATPIPQKSASSAPAPVSASSAAKAIAPTPKAAAAVAMTAPVAKPVTQEPLETAALDPTIIREPPEKIVPKLQAVVYSPKRPSAIVTGRTVFVGDRLGEFRVVGITQESVTLVGGGQTNVLVLGE